MSKAAPVFVCHGCGARVSSAERLPFTCSRAVAGDDIDHVLVPVDGGALPYVVRSEADPFLRYRALLSPYRLARAVGLSEEAWSEFVGELDERLIEAEGRGFRITPATREERLAKASGAADDLWIKDETGNVAGSHKARHLMGVMLYLRVLQAGRLRPGQDLRARRLAIASCGNAALAAAVIARAADWPLDVFIPPDAPPAVVLRLKDLGAGITVCERRPGETGDPCVSSFRRAVLKGAIPFGVQGPDNGLAIEGGRTIAFEMAEAFHDAGIAPAAIYVQIGGGALASAVAQGFAIAVAQGWLAERPRLITVQTAGCAPLARAWQRLHGVDLNEAVRHRSRFMQPWATTPHSIAHGILDDETYDWWEVAKGMRETGGHVIVADEACLERAYALASANTAIRTSATGTAGLAGLLRESPGTGTIAVLFSGAER